MTAQIEAAPGSGLGEDVPSEPIRHPAIFAPLFAPFGISSGYVSVTLAFLLSRAGLPTAVVAAVIAMSIWPQTWKMLWAPLVDTIGNPKLWYGLGAAIVGACILAMSVLPMTRAQIPLFSIIIVFSSVASTLVSMSSEIFMANNVPLEMRGRASGWSQAGNLGGSGIGGGLGLLIAEHVTEQWVSGAVLAAICFGCWAAVLFIPGHVRKPHTLNYLGSLKGVLLDVWAVARSRLGFLALVIMVLPLASGGVPWSAISLEWKAGGDTVALVNGVAGGLAAAVGALVGGYVCDRMDVKRAYCVFAVLAGLVAAAMTLAPRGQATFVIFVLGYQFMIGAGYAGYVAIVLEAIGTRSAATNFNLMAALANVPIALMTTFDGWVHDKYGTDAMLFGELLVPIAAIIGFALLVAVTRRRRAVA